MISRAGSGRINRKELKHAIARAGYETFSGEYTLVEAVLEAAGDLDGDGKLSRWEINAHAAQEVARPSPWAVVAAVCLTSSRPANVRSK